MGTCAPIPAGIKPKNAAQCAKQEVSSCGTDGTCDGLGGCRTYPDGTICTPGTCDVATVVGEKVCLGGKCEAGPKTICTPFSCDPAAAQCFGECTNDSQCAPGQQCKDGSCGKKPGGAACDSADECISGFCADGVCCNTSCDGACVSCNQPLKMGECLPVAKGLPDPRMLCKDEGANTCGTSGVCDGEGACARYSNTTVCRPSRCEGNSEVAASTCDGKGSCNAGGQTACLPFICSAGMCKSECMSDADCFGGNTCIGGSCGKKGNGQECKGNNQCQSNFCVDGVCCESACQGQCRFCASQQAKGKCVNVAAGVPDPRLAAGITDPALVCTQQDKTTCGRNGMCNGNGGCQRWDNKTVCAPESCSTSTNTYSEPKLCNGSGQCRAQGSQTCAPYKCNGKVCATACGADNQCTGDNVCTLGSCGKKPDGAKCNNKDAECDSGYCRQGVCCQTNCSSRCFACNLPGSQGVCTAVPAGAPDPAGVCKDETVSTCRSDGTCDGSGQCRLYAKGRVCAAASCSNGSEVPESICNGTGTCEAGSPRTCGNYKCNTGGTECFESCSTNAQCANNNSCDANGSCGKKPVGGSCQANAECENGNCSQGVCCNVKCDGVCKACNLEGKRGTCSNVNQGQPDVAGRCETKAPETCGTTGVCDGAGACAFHASTVVCRQKTCVDGPSSSSATPETKCDGKGQCPPAPTATTCPLIRCDTTNNVCLPNCMADGQCVPSSFCDEGSMSCGGRRNDGEECTSQNQCKTGSRCVEGVCCSGVPAGQNSCGPCKSCKVAGKFGTCQAVPATPAGQSGPGACAPGPTEHPICGTIAACDGSGNCRKAPTGLACGTTCSGTTSVSSKCNGSGSCVADPGVTCPNNLTCNDQGTGCRSNCSENSHCTGGKVCQTGVCVDPPTPKGGACGEGKPNCAADLGLELQCVDGVCCASSCKGPCEQCNAQGDCVPVTSGADPLCSPNMQNRACNTGQCTSNGTVGVCAVNTCASGCSPDKSGVVGSTCNGAGGCTNQPMDCPNGLTCNESTGQCRNKCQDDAGCQAGYYCQNWSQSPTFETCVKKVGKGEECEQSQQCDTSGVALVCSQGVCCTSACTDTCKTCNGSQNKGECSFVGVGGVDPDNRCVASNINTMPCGQDGTCNGAGACTLRADVACGKMCSAGDPSTSYVELMCDGAGGCSRMGQPVPCQVNETCRANASNLPECLMDSMSMMPPEEN
ncbi:MAG: hypothetical protein KA712_02990 [Myxococcales bacterium]|nr:hypothetical protein [Myxococcales bacterium]